MTWRHLILDTFDKVLRITINRPAVRNAQSRVLLEELDAALLAAAADDAVRVIVIAGAGKDFSAGHDLGSTEELEDRRQRPRAPGIPGEYERIIAMNLENCLRWRDLPKPTIAQVQGHCIMGGLMLATCCDLIVAADDAVFADRTVAWGGAHVQYFAMPWEIGARKTKEYLFTAGTISAKEAAELGLVNRVVPRVELESSTLELAARIARNDAFALRMAKLSVNETLDRQGQRQALEMAFKNYMATLPHRKELGTFGEPASQETARDRLARNNGPRD